MTFDTNGAVDVPGSGQHRSRWPFPDLSDGAGDLNISWDPYNNASAGRITQFGQASAASASSQDGRPRRQNW